MVNDRIRMCRALKRIPACRAEGGMSEMDVVDEAFAVATDAAPEGKHELATVCDAIMCLGSCGFLLRAASWE